MTVVGVVLFNEAFSELVARATAEPFVDLAAIARNPEMSLDGFLRLGASDFEAEAQNRRFADLESWISARALVSAASSR